MTPRGMSKGTKHVLWAMYSVFECLNPSHTTSTAEPLFVVMVFIRWCGRPWQIMQCASQLLGRGKNWTLPTKWSRCKMHCHSTVHVKLCQLPPVSWTGEQRPRRRARGLRQDTLICRWGDSPTCPCGWHEARRRHQSTGGQRQAVNSRAPCGLKMNKC